MIARTLALLVISLVVAGPASAAVVINEVESNDPAPGPDWVELYNNGATSVDISNYVIKDNQDANAFTVPAATTLDAGGYYVADGLGFALDSSDSARLFTPADPVNPIDSYTWTTEPTVTYGRCANGSGAFAATNDATKGAANSCAVPLDLWPGPSAIQTADDANVFGNNLSGLAYQSSGTLAPGVLWAVRNSPETLFRLVRGSTGIWGPDTADGWSAGKALRFPDGIARPDSEDLTLAAGDPTGVYVSSERDTQNPGVSRPAVYRYDVTGAGGTLTATKEWNLTADLPGLGPNLGPEALTWLSDDVLVSKGFLDEATGLPYNPATYPNHGSGLFFVGIEQDGRIVAYALNQAAGTYTRIATIASGFRAVMALQYDSETKLLRAICDDTCDGRQTTLDIATQGPSAGRFVVTHMYQRPAGMANLNNEGFTITPQTECFDNVKPVFWAEDGVTDNHSLRSGLISCTSLPGNTTPAPTPQSPTPTPETPTQTPTPTPTPPATVRDTTKPVLSRVRASRTGVSFRISERAKVKVTIERLFGKRFKRVKAFTVTVAAGSRTIRFKGHVPAAALKRGRLRITLVATDAAGNRSAAVRKLV